MDWVNFGGFVCNELLLGGGGGSIGFGVVVICDLEIGEEKVVDGV